MKKEKSREFEQKAKAGMIGKLNMHSVVGQKRARCASGRDPVVFPTKFMCQDNN